MRFLFSSEYLDSGCDPLFYVEDDAFDDTIGTWLTNYAIFSVCLFYAIKFLSCPPYKRKSNIELITNDSEENPNVAQQYDLNKGDQQGKEKRDDINHHHQLYNLYLVYFLQDKVSPLV